MGPPVDDGGPSARRVLVLFAVVGAALATTPVWAEPVYAGAASRGPLPADVAASFRASLDRAAAKQGVQLLDASGAADEDTAGALTRARDALEEAKRAYTEGDRAGALAAAKAAFEGFERGPAYSDDDTAWNIFRDVQSLRALVFFDQKKQAQAEDALRTLLVVMPDYVPRRDRAPPALVRAVEAVRDELRSLPPVALEVRSKPAGATVYIDGRRRGRAPLLVEDLTPGVHYVVVEESKKQPPARHTERVLVEEGGGSVNAVLGSRRSASSVDVLTSIARPSTPRAFARAVGDVDEDVIAVVLLPAGRKVEVVGARVVRGEVRVVCGLRVADTDNDRERGTYELIEALLERRSDVWLGAARDEDVATLRDHLFSGTGTESMDIEEPDEAEPISPALIAVGVIAGVVTTAAAGAGLGYYLYRESQKDAGFTWSVDTSGL